MTLAFLFIGAACGKDEEGKATNDSPSTVDEVINTTGITTATTQTTVKPTEKVNEAPTNTPKEEKPEEHEDKNGENTYKEEPTESGKMMSLIIKVSRRILRQSTATRRIQNTRLT